MFQDPYGYQQQPAPYGYQDPYGYQQQPPMPYGYDAAPTYFPEDDGGYGEMESFDDGGYYAEDDYGYELGAVTYEQIEATFVKVNKRQPTEAEKQKLHAKYDEAQKKLAEKIARAQKAKTQGQVKRALEKERKHGQAALRGRMMAEKRVAARHKEQDAAKEMLRGMQAQLNEAHRAMAEEKRMGTLTDKYQDTVDALQAKVDAYANRMARDEALTAQAEQFMKENPAAELPPEMQKQLLETAVQASVTQRGPGDEDMPAGDEGAPGDVELNDE